ncbi:MAG TPA: DUF2520 domain-containing protein [Gemmatimonadaceae bacterium]|nr:DUF2520 domain-containing protein [Gemmatimonadaceae bacterium]
MTERVFVLGAGRAGRGLARALRLGGVDVVGLHGRHTGDIQDHVTVGALPAALGDATTVLVTVRDAQLDAALNELAQAPLGADAVVLHASGSADPPALAELRSRGHAAGTFHPLVPLADPDRAPAILRDAWIGLDGDDAARARGRALAAALGAHTLDIPAGRKPLYHAAAVLVSNFPPVLLALGERAMAEAGLPRDLARQALLPLWTAAAENARAAAFPALLTGPAVRGDLETIRANMEALAGDPTAQEVYRVVTEAIQAMIRESGTR